MRPRTLLKMIREGRVATFLLLARPMNQFLRLTFLSTLVQEGLHTRLAEGPVSLEDLAVAYGGTEGGEALESFLNLGLRLKEIELGPRGYRLRSPLIRRLAKPDNDGFAALLTEVVLLAHETITRAPSLIRSRSAFPFPERYGELIARSSTALQDLLFSVVDEVVPARGPFRLLEVGCGSGLYIRRACERNPGLTAVGLELQEKVARFAEANLRAWGLGGRVEIRNTDIRRFESRERFDLVTLHNNIYYFARADRADLAAHLKDLLKPGGRLVITTGCRGGSPLMEYLNLHCVLTEGLDALPEPRQLVQQLEGAGFRPVESKRLLPARAESFYAFLARKPLEGSARS